MKQIELKIKSEEDFFWLLFRLVLQEKNPPKTFRVGRPSKDLSKTFFGILYSLRKNCVWRKIPAQFGPFTTCHHYFKKWSEKGLFKDFFELVIALSKYIDFLSKENFYYIKVKKPIAVMKNKKSLVTFEYGSKNRIKCSLCLDKKNMPTLAFLEFAKPESLSPLLWGLESSNIVKSVSKNSKKIIKK